MFDWWSQVTAEDKAIVSRQLGREPRGLMAVARRCRFGAPQVVVTQPVVLGPGRRTERKAGVKADELRVFPTTYWLTCRYLAAAVGRLEGAGWISRVKDWLSASGLEPAMAAAHSRAAAERVALLDDEMKERLATEQPAQYQVLLTAGVAGARATAGVKCLHAHLADYLAGPAGTTPGMRNPAGARVLTLLLQHGYDVTGWPGDAGCPHCSGCGEGENGAVCAMDVGTNSCRYLVVKPANGAWQRVAAGLVTTRLGEGLHASGRLNPAAIRRTIDGLAALLKEVKQIAPEPRLQLAAVATNAVRSAHNGEEFLLAAWEELGLSTRVVAGAEEAELSFRGALAASAAGDATAPGLLAVLDIGGGSTELVVGTRQGEVAWRNSVSLGAVRLTELAAGWQPPENEGDDTASAAKQAAAAAYVAKLTATAKQMLAELRLPENLLPARAIGVGGTCTTFAAIDLKLAEYDPARVQGYVLSAERVAALTNALAAMSQQERQHVPGLLSTRADIIVAGGAILLAMMRILRLAQIAVSDADILLGVAQQFFNACKTTANRV